MDVKIWYFINSLKICILNIHKKPKFINFLTLNCKIASPFTIKVSEENYYSENNVKVTPQKDISTFPCTKINARKGFGEPNRKKFQTVATI